MYAVIQTGGKQYRVAPGDVIQVEKLPAEVGDEVQLDQVLLVSDDDGVLIGRPLLQGAWVKAQVMDQARHRKVLVFKYRRRKRYRRKTGHRQPYTALKIGEISTGGAASEAQA